MLFSRLSVAVLLSLLLALGAGISQAHSHDGHEAEQCIFSVAQTTSFTIAPDSVFFILGSNSTQQAIALTEPCTCSLRTTSQPRAPPLTSK